MWVALRAVTIKLREPEPASVRRVHDAALARRGLAVAGVRSELQNFIRARVTGFARRAVGLCAKEFLERITYVPLPCP